MLRKVADGGMAEIFLAQQTGEEGFSRLVIVKRILPDLAADPHFRNMLVDEAHIAMTLNHSNVVPVLDLGRSEGSTFLVMELVDGWDLAQVHDRGRDAGYPFPLGLTMYVMAQVCRGLAYAHGRRDAQERPLGIVHRDVSPQNVLISEHGEVKVTDFGIAKALGKRERTQTGIIKGKLDFMSPEQASGAELNASSDIFAAGTMLYFLATGRRPFASPSDFEALLRVQRADFVAADQARPGLSPAVAAGDRQGHEDGPGRSLPQRRGDDARPGGGDAPGVRLARAEPAGALADGAGPARRRPAGVEAAGHVPAAVAHQPLVRRGRDAVVRRQQQRQQPAGGSLALSAGSLALSAAAPPPSAPSLTHGGPEPFRPAPAYAPPVTAGSSLPSALGPGPTRPRSRYRMMLVPPPRRRGLLRALVVLLLLVAAGAVAVDRFVSKEQQRELQTQAKQLVKKGVDGVASVIESSQAQPDPVKAQNEKQSGMTPDRERGPRCPTRPGWRRRWRAPAGGAAVRK